MEAVVSEAKKIIDETYATQTIHKSIIVCHDDIIRMQLYESLKADDYPACSLVSLLSFVRDKSRMMLIDFTDLGNIESFFPRKTLKQINCVFLIERAHLRGRDGFKWRHFNFADDYKVIKV